ncbi:NAD-dependent epimerase/dehydratase family protein [Candidatus Mycobacterium methanotrophicum]|uniref:NAD-dependent epimerase/dehydratase family protein n=1 Tax=Candidatus Mycobacterium methanotrophicum TaxID=2943498 RepID=UPI003F817EAC
MRILLTGVTGLVGRAVARQLLAAGFEVSGTATRPHENLDPGVDFVCGGSANRCCSSWPTTPTWSFISPRPKPLRPAAPE